MAADRTHMIGQLTVAAKNGQLGGGSGVDGSGSACLFGGTVNG